MKSWWQKLTTPTGPQAAAGGALEQLHSPVDDDAADACGWYESSWELKRGLAVVEVEALELAVWDLVNGEPARA